MKIGQKFKVDQRIAIALSLKEDYVYEVLSRNDYFVNLSNDGKIPINFLKLIWNSQ